MNRVERKTAVVTRLFEVLSLFKVLCVFDLLKLFMTLLEVLCVEFLEQVVVFEFKLREVREHCVVVL
ncbi:MAG: hypothetical protein HQ472_02400 [Ignavibacteria bacterium]|nr:hypothetical protein [Ignavibacteria bacterium]